MAIVVDEGRRAFYNRLLMSKKRVNRFEQFAQRLVEGRLRRLFGERDLSHEIVRALGAAIDAEPVGAQIPSMLMVYFSPSDLPHEEERERFGAQVEAVVRQLTESSNRTLPTKLKIELFSDVTLSEGEIRVETAEATQPHEVTQVQERPLSPKQPDLAAMHTLDAYLIVAGKRHVTLDQPLMTIGRQLENDIVLDEATISRKHAQIRWRFGRFVLYDLSKRGRTVVNGIKVTEHALNPGDVIALSHVMLIYGEGRTRPHTVIKQQGDDDTPTRQMPKLDL